MNKCAVSFALAVVALAVVALGAAPSVAAAQAASADEQGPLARVAGPTSGDASVLSGRTLGEGETMLSAGVGWPGIYAEIALAPTSELNVHVRGTVLYGSPVMGLDIGVGGELAVPVRVHVFGDGIIDLALRLTPRLALGEGAIFGEHTSGLGGALGGALLVDAHGVFGFHVDSRITLIAGAGGGAGGSSVDGSTQGVAPVGRVSGEVGLEALMARDTMLFALVEGGYGFAPDRSGVAFYGAREVLGVSLGVAYLL